MRGDQGCDVAKKMRVTAVALALLVVVTFAVSEHLDKEDFPSDRRADFEPNNFLESAVEGCPNTCAELDTTNCNQCTECSCDWCQSTRKCHSKHNSLAQCGSPWYRSEDECNTPKIKGPPVILIPGVGGTQLWAECFQARDVRHIWARISALGDHLKETMMGEYDTKKDKYLGWNEKKGLYRIYVPDGAAGLFSIDTVNWDVKDASGKVAYFRVMAEHLQAAGYRPNENLFGFGYDWRQSNSDKDHMRKLATLIKDTCKKTGKKVAILAHSMGNLVTKSMMTVGGYRELMEECVDRWIAMGAPWQGAVTGGIGLISGYNFNMPQFVVKPYEAHRLEVGVPSLLELLPNPEWDWEYSPDISVSKKGTRKAIKPDEQMYLFQAVNKNHYQMLDGERYHMPLKDAQKMRAERTRKTWKAGLPKGVKLYNIYGTAQDTRHVLHFDRDIESEWGELMLDPFNDEKTGWAPGDGTVSMESAKNPGPGFPVVAEATVETDHTEMIKDPVMFEHIRRFLTDGGEESTAADMEWLESYTLPEESETAESSFEWPIGNDKHSQKLWNWVRDCPAKGTVSLIFCFMFVMIGAMYSLIFRKATASKKEGSNPPSYAAVDLTRAPLAISVD